MVAQGQERVSGLTGGYDLARDEAEVMLEPVVPDDDGLDGGPNNRPEDVHLSLTPAWSRMRTDRLSADRDILRQIRSAVDLMIIEKFGDLFDIHYLIYSLVREPDVDTTTGALRIDEHGLPAWKRSSTGAYIEDWSKMTRRELEGYLFQLTTGLFHWEQRAADIWGEALFAKANFEEAFSHAYEELPNPRATIEDRTARARIRAAEHRYAAVYASYFSRRAEAVVRAAERLNQRLKDVLVAG